MGRLLPILVFFVALAGCASSPGPRGEDRILGLLVLEGTEQPIAGATLTLTPIAPLPQARPDDLAEPHDLATEQRSGPSGAFGFGALEDPEQAERSLARGWEYELRADAPGFYSTVDRVDFEGGQLAVVLEIEVIEDEMTYGDGGIIVGEQPPDRLKDMQGTLVKEVLRRLGRSAPAGRPTN